MFPVLKTPESLPVAEAREAVDRAAKAVEARKLGSQLREGKIKSYRQIVGRI